ncbi:MAG: glycosyltransferase family 2 protein, partial [Candidatus Methylomirabilis sp.]
MTNPTLTIAVMAYNSELYVEQAALGAFSQTYRPLEIILSDDCSVDSTFEIMQRMAARYQGPHRIVVNRNTRNVGVSGHINRIMEISSGQL